MSLSWVVEPAVEVRGIASGGKQQLLCVAAQILGFSDRPGGMSLNGRELSGHPQQEKTSFSVPDYRVSCGPIGARSRRLPPHRSSAGDQLPTDRPRSTPSSHR
jgi:hypothetical protein